MNFNFGSDASGRWARFLNYQTLSCWLVIALLQNSTAQTPTTPKGEASSPPPNVAPAEGNAPVRNQVPSFEPRPRVEVLNRVAQEFRINLGKLKTWQGAFVVTDTMQVGGKVAGTKKYHVTYCVDQTKESFRWNRKTIEETVASGGATNPGDLTYESGMRKRDTFIRYGPKKLSSSHGAAATSGPTNLINYGIRSTDFDPMYFFSDFGSDLGNRFDFFYQHSGDFTWHWKTSVVADRVQVESVVNIGTNRYVMDLSKGATAAELFLQDRDEKSQTVTQETKWTGEYRQVNDVWVPHLIMIYNETKANSSRTNRVVEWIDQKVNEPLPEDAFSTAAMETLPGDIVFDRRSGTQMVVPGEIIRMGSPDQRPPDAARSNFRWLLVAISVCVLGSLFVWWIRRRLNRRGTPAG